jgi:Flp pilus assembly protein TadG
MGVTNRRPAPPRLRGDDGVVLTEVAILTPVLLALVFGIFEFGLLFRDYLSLSDAVSDGVRWGSLQGDDVRYIADPDDPDADVAVSPDYSIVAAIRESTAALPKDSIERIVVYKARSSRFGSAMDQLPAACKTGASSNALKCNVYPANEAFLAVQNGDLDYFDCSDDASSPECGWPQDERNDGPAASQIEYIGVYVKVNHDMVTGFFGRNFTLERAQTLRLEPGQVE